MGLTMQGAPGCEGAANRHAWRVQQQAAALESVKWAQGISSTADTQNIRSRDVKQESAADGTKAAVASPPPMRHWLAQCSADQWEGGRRLAAWNKGFRSPAVVPAIATAAAQRHAA